MKLSVPSIDACVVGSGPNGLSAAIALSRAGYRVVVLEAAETPGGGMRTEQLTLPGFQHDVCSAVHTTGIVSPFFAELDMAKHGLQWCFPEASAAHPMDDGSAAVLSQSVELTAESLGQDGPRYRRLLEPFLQRPKELVAELLGPLRVPKHLFLLLRFGLLGIPSSERLCRRFSGQHAKALVAGCAAHSVLPLDRATTAAVALAFLIIGHVRNWPVVRGGSRELSNALLSILRELGGELRLGTRVRSLDDLPPSRVVLFDTDPRQVAAIAGEALPRSYRQRLERYRYGPGVFKLDYALSESIPWKAEACRLASTVHVGGTFEEIAAAEAAVWEGEHPERPFVMVCQQSEFDSSRAPAGQQTGYAYCHVPAGSNVDMTAAIEAQLERFAPGFRDTILQRSAMTPEGLQGHNANNVGGAITGGVADLFQLFTRPVFRLDPYSTPNPRLFMCSHSTPPGAGVHGMCGYFAAQSALRRLARRR